MKKQIKKIIKKIIPNKIKKNHWLREKVSEILLLYRNNKFGISYSQQGEDIMLIKSEILELNKKGFYVDIGAHHPKIFSNTYLLYKAGWSGINIDPIQEMEKRFKSRKMDINLNIGISSNNKFLDYYSFHPSPYNTVDADRVKELEKEKLFPYKKEKIETKRLSEVLNKYAKDKEIDFMSIDVEGFELDVLQSNDWNKFKPKIILIEIHNVDFNNLGQNPIHSYLTKLGYELFARTPFNSFYKQKY